MTNTKQKIELYTPQHYLVNLQDMADEALAVVSDDDMNKYEEEHAVYLAKQKEAVKVAFEMIDECKKTFVSLFGGTDSNEYKYLNRAVTNRRTVPDVHADSVPSPQDIRQKVKDARNKVNVRDLQTSSTITEEGISEINKALSYLVSNGLVLNKDFTLSNAVSVATSHKGMNMMRTVVSKNRGQIKVDEDVVVLGECEDESCKAHSGGYTINRDADTLMARCDCYGNTYDISFKFEEDGTAKTVLTNKNYEINE